MKKNIAIIGAGPGGLTSAMLLSQKGYNVTVYEKRSSLGGRNGNLSIEGFNFDIGPTFLMMTFILREVFEAAGRNIDDYLKIQPLDPMYRLNFPNKTVEPTSDHSKMEAVIEELFPGESKGFRKLIKREKQRYRYMYPCLQKPYGTIGSLFSLRLLKAFPHLSVGKTLFQVLSSYFKSEALRIAFTFQAKYIGMSPWECPGLYTMIPYVEHGFGIDHVEGGLSKISEAMAKVVEEEKGKIHLSTAVKEVKTNSKKEATGVILENGEEIDYDAVIVNADFGHAATNLFAPGVIRKWNKKTLEKKKFSCSTLMFYLGLDKLYDEPHHQIIFAESYKDNIDDIIKRKVLSDDMSIYLRNASINDKTIAPKGKSALYILVPVANQRSGIKWTEELVKSYRDKIMERIKKRTSMKDIEDHIEVEKCITPKSWEKEYDLFAGSTFNLGHNLSQMLYFRPHNKFEEVKNCYLVGGGTHPGSGLPTIYESGRISADLIEKDFPL